MPSVKKLPLWLLLWNLLPPATALLYLRVLLPLCRSLLHFTPFCLTHALLHLYCPGCGGTRAVAALLRGHLGEAFLCNPAVSLLALLLLFFDVCALWAIARRSLAIYRTRGYRLCRDGLLAVFVATVLLGTVVRDVLLVTGRADYLGDLLFFWT